MTDVQCFFCACLVHFSSSVLFSFSRFSREMFFPYNPTHPFVVFICIYFRLWLMIWILRRFMKEQVTAMRLVCPMNLVGRSGKAVKCETAKWCEADRMSCTLLDWLFDHLFDHLSFMLLAQSS